MRTAPKRERWELADALPGFRAAVARAPSEHLNGAFEGDIRANDLADGYPSLGPTPAIALGAAVVEALHPRGSDAIAVYFAMVKRAPGYAPADGDWEYVVADRDGSVVERGALPLCARCHADAPHDHLFGRSR